MKLTVNQLGKSFGGTQALDGVSFTACSGSPLGLLGRNGAGKTTAMRIIMNIFDPDRGEVLLDGVPIRRSGVRLGYLPEERGLYRSAEVSEQLVYFARLRGMSRGDALRAAAGWLERLDMTQYSRRRVETLSKGNQQRIQLALALINDPEVVVLDEPFSGLDPVGVMELRSVIAEVAARDRVVIFSSHQMSAVEDFCRGIVILKKGRVVLDDSLPALRAAAPKNRIRLSPALPETGRLAAAFGSVAWEKEGLLVTLEREEQRAELFAALASAGAEIARFETVEPTLEEIFVSAAGEEPVEGVRA